MKTTKPKAAAAARIGAALGRRKRAELLELLWPCLARTEPWLQAGKYAAAVMSDLRRRNGWTIACLRATGRQVYPINPMSVARYRDRHSVAGRKSDHGDSFVLVGVLRTGMHAHRSLPAGTGRPISSGWAPPRAVHPQAAPAAPIRDSPVLGAEDNSCL